MNYIYNAYHHFLTITKHKCEVMKNCFAVGLYRQGLLHDLSKYSWEEFATGVKYYQGNRSPNAAEKEEKGYSVHGCTTRDATNIISNTGSILHRTSPGGLSAIKCPFAT